MSKIKEAEYCQTFEKIFALPSILIAYIVLGSEIIGWAKPKCEYCKISLVEKSGHMAF